MEHLPLNDTTYFQYQIDLLRQELENNVTSNNDFKTLSIQNWRMKERIKMTQLKFYIKKIECLKRKTSALKTELKISKR